MSLCMYRHELFHSIQILFIVFFHLVAAFIYFTAHLGLNFFLFICFGDANITSFFLVRKIHGQSNEIYNFAMWTFFLTFSQILF